MKLICASPTCTATISVPDRLSRSVLHETLRYEGWSIEQHATDDRSLAYCPRDREATNG